MVLLADPSAEGDLIAAALRQNGLSVISSEIVALPERVSRLQPLAVVVNLDQPHVDVALQQLSEPEPSTPGTSSGGGSSARVALIIAIGTPAQAEEMGLTEAPGTRVFVRPVEVEALAAHLVEQALGRGSIPVAHAPSSDGSAPRAEDSEAALLSDFPAIAGLPEVESILPDLEGAPASGGMTAQLSPEIEALMEAAANRVKREQRAVEPAQPQDLDILVPTAMLALLDDLAARAAASPPTHGMPAMPFGAEGMPVAGLGPGPGPAPAQLSPAQPSPAQLGASQAGQPPLAPYPQHQPEAVPQAPHPTGPTGPLARQVSPPTAGAAGPAAGPPAPTVPGPPDLGSEHPPTSAGLPLDERTGAFGPGTQVGPSRPSAPARESASPRTSAGLPSWAVPPIGSATDAGDPWSAAPFTPSATSTSRSPWPGPPEPAPASPEAPLAAPPANPEAPAPAPGPLQGAPSAPGAEGWAALQGQTPMASPEEGQPQDGPPRRKTTSSRYPKVFGSPQAPGAPSQGDESSQAGDGSSHDSSAPVTTLGQPAALRPLPPSSSRAEQGDPLEMLAAAVRTRFTGALALASPDGQRLRRILLRDGDLVNAASEVENETLLDLLIERGDLSPEATHLRTAKLPRGGRHAAAALIANGYLGQDDLWTVLRAHAEWIIARTIRDGPAICQLESEPPEHLRAEPNVFGGAAGVEVFVEAVRRSFRTDEAIRRLGGADAQIGEGAMIELLAESALGPAETDLVRRSVGARVGELLSLAGPELATVLCALVSLQILAAHRRAAQPAASTPEPFDPLDADAIRRQVGARLALVRDADYFALLGVEPKATAYQIRQAYTALRRRFEPSRILTGATADLSEDVLLIIDVLEEAYEILRDPHRRRRYRRAIEATAR